MRALAIALTTLAVAAVVSLLVMSYVAIFAHNETLGNAAFLTFFVALLAGFGSAATWALGDDS